MKKRTISLLSALILAVVLIQALGACASDEIRVYLNGERLEFDVPPQIINNHVMLPMHVIFRTLNATLEWREDTREVLVGFRPMYSITFQIDNPKVRFESGYFSSSYEIELDASPQIVDGEILVPLNAVSEIFGACVEWDAIASKVTIETGERDVLYPSQLPVAGQVIGFGGRIWRVLDVEGNYALLLHETVILNEPFHWYWVDATWDVSTSRQWLNNEFLNTFSEANRARIRETLVVTYDNPWFGTTGGMDTTDKVFLLSIEEVLRYFGDSGMLLLRQQT